MELTITQLAQRIDAERRGDASGQITAVGAVAAAKPGEVTFITDDRHIAGLEKSGATAVIVAHRIEGLAKPQLIVKNINAALIEALRVFAPKLKAPQEGIDPTAKVAESAKIAKGVSIGPGVVIDEGVQIGQNCIIAAGCKIGQNSKLGENCRLDNNVVVYHNCTFGNNVIIQANSTIGATGFGYYFIDGAHELIPHNGGVVIEDFVEIGANSCVDRAKFGNTIIGAGTKIDNLVQIAHNVVIGKCCLIAGLVGLAGSCKIGDGVVMAGGSGVGDNVEIGDGTIVGARAIAHKDVAAGQKLFGTPATDKTKMFRALGLMMRLPKIVEQLKQLTKRIDKLETAKDDKE